MSGACVLVCARTGSSCRASGSRWPTESLLIDLVCALDIELQPYHKSAPGRIPHGALTAEASGVAAAAPGCRGGPEASQRA